MRVEFSKVISPMLGVFHPVLSLQVTLHRQVMALVLRPVVYSLTLFARSRYWRDSKSERVIADN